VDLKISKPSDGKAQMYQSQLWAYQYALENPDEGDPLKISKLALLIFYPESVLFENGQANLTFPPQWLEVEYNHDGFMNFMKEVNTLLVGPLPDEGETCKWCAYRHKGEEIAHHLQSLPTGDEPPF